MNLPPEAARRTETDQVAWLTTVADSGAPAPNPVWFVVDRGALVVFSQRETRKVHNLEARPKVALHFNSDVGGGDVVVINGDAELTHDQKPSEVAPYLAKYESTITGALGMTVDEYDRTYSTRIRIEPTRVRLTAT
jgi:PPOX class probable F420-dependent enzyme